MNCDHVQSAHSELQVRYQVNLTCTVWHSIWSNDKTHSHLSSRLISRDQWIWYVYVWIYLIFFYGQLCFENILRIWIYNLAKYILSKSHISIHANSQERFMLHVFAKYAFHMKKSCYHLYWKSTLMYHYFRWSLQTQIVGLAFWVHKTHVHLGSSYVVLRLESIELYR